MIKGSLWSRVVCIFCIICFETTTSTVVVVPLRGVRIISFYNYKERFFPNKTVLPTDIRASVLPCQKWMVFFTKIVPFWHIFFHSKTPTYLYIEQIKLATLYQKLWSGDPCCCTYYWRFSHIFDQNFQSFLSNLEKNFKYFQLLSAEKQRKKALCEFFKKKCFPVFFLFIQTFIIDL